ncbi:MAG: YjbQ family protein [Bacteroidetes bacterium]|nr:MAG: YjbQ family protein [Bacteroidota bacterium]
MVNQIEISLPSFRRGYHLITHIIKNELGDLPDTGILQVFIKHSSAGLTINENADPTVRVDFESFLNELIPENHPLYRHVMEGSDDMPAHLKASLLGTSVSVPITNGRLNLGTWQGIYLCEFRNHGGSRKLVISVIS